MVPIRFLGTLIEGVIEVPLAVKWGWYKGFQGLEVFYIRGYRR